MYSIYFMCETFLTHHSSSMRPCFVCVGYGGRNKFGYPCTTSDENLERICVMCNGTGVYDCHNPKKICQICYGDCIDRFVCTNCNSTGWVYVTTSEQILSDSEKHFMRQLMQDVIELPVLSEIISKKNIMSVLVTVLNDLL